MLASNVALQICPIHPDALFMVGLGNQITWKPVAAVSEEDTAWTF